MYKSDASYVSCRAGVYYYTRRVPYDVRQHYASNRLSFSLRTKSNAGASRENFGAELILLSLEARKIGDAYDLSGIALGFAMWLFKTVDGGHHAAQKVVAYNSALGEAISVVFYKLIGDIPTSINFGGCFENSDNGVAR